MKLLCIQLLLSLALWIGETCWGRLGAQEVPDDTPPEIQKLLEAGGAAQVNGHLDEAWKAYRQACNLATAAGIGNERSEHQHLKEVQAYAALKCAEIAEALAANGDHSKSDSDISGWYQQAIEVGNEEQRALAQNNLGMYWLRQGKPVDAVAVLRQMEFDRIKPGQRFVYAYNYGRALELVGKPTEAYEQYLHVIDIRPDFDRAALRAFALLAKSKPPKIGDAAKFAAFLLSKGRATLVIRQVLELLNRWGGDPSAFRLLAVLVQAYAQANISPNQFEDKIGQPLEEIATRYPNWNKTVQEVRDAYQRVDLKVSFDYEYPSTVFPAWTTLGRAFDSAGAFAHLLKRAGDFYVQAASGHPGDVKTFPWPTERDENSLLRQGLARYVAAWVMNPHDTEAVLYATALLRDHAAKLDPEHQIKNQLIDRLFAEKGQLIELPRKTKKDWQNLSRLHTVLATIFEAEKEWGSTSQPRSALFQWDHAAKAEEALRAMDPMMPPSPGIHVHLATAYQATDNTELARAEYLKATQGFLDLSNPLAATATLASARALPGEPTDAQSQQVASLGDAITLQIDPRARAERLAQALREVHLTDEQKERVTRLGVFDTERTSEQSTELLNLQKQYEAEQAKLAEALMHAAPAEIDEHQRAVEQLTSRFELTRNKFASQQAQLVGEVERTLSRDQQQKLMEIAYSPEGWLPTSRNAAYIPDESLPKHPNNDREENSPRNVIDRSDDKSDRRDDRERPQKLDVQTLERSPKAQQGINQERRSGKKERPDTQRDGNLVPSDQPSKGGQEIDRTHTGKKDRGDDGRDH